MIKSARESKELEKRKSEEPILKTSPPWRRKVWNAPEKNPKGPTIIGVMRHARAKITITNRINPIVFPDDVAIINLLIHTRMQSQAWAQFYDL
jgi:hypothetical protein